MYNAYEAYDVTKSRADQREELSFSEIKAQLRQEVLDGPATERGIGPVDRV